jgi:hypothetical protein
MRRDLPLAKLAHQPSVDATGWKLWQPLLLRMADIIKEVSREVLGEPFELASVRRYRQGLDTASGVRLFMLGALKYEMQGSRFGSEDWESDSLNGDLMVRLACMPEEEWLKGPASFRSKFGDAGGDKVIVDEQAPQPPKKDKGKARDCSEQDARSEKEKVCYVFAQPRTVLIEVSCEKGNAAFAKGNNLLAYKHYTEAMR